MQILLIFYIVLMNNILNVSLVVPLCAMQTQNVMFALDGTAVYNPWGLGIIASSYYYYYYLIISERLGMVSHTSMALSVFVFIHCRYGFTEACDTECVEFCRPVGRWLHGRKNCWFKVVTQQGFCCCIPKPVHRWKTYLKQPWSDPALIPGMPASAASCARLQSSNSERLWFDWIR